MTGSIYLTIALATVVTVALRATPIIMLSRFTLPTLVRDWLGYIPAAIMAAIIAAELIHRPAMTPSGISVSLLAAIASCAVGLVSRSLFLTVIAGIVAFLGFQALLGG